MVIPWEINYGVCVATLCNRWCKHKQDSKTCNRHLYKSMRKYGLENFTIEEIDNTEDFKELGSLDVGNVGNCLKIEFPTRHFKRFGKVLRGSL